MVCRSYRRYQVVMSHSCVNSYKGLLSGFFFVVRGNSRHGFSGFGNFYSTDRRTTLPQTSDSSAQKPTTTSSRKHKSDTGPVITLIGTDNSPSVVSLSDAEKLAKRRDLKLVRIVDLDTKTQRPIYQLMTGPQYYSEDRKQRNEKSTKKESGIKGDKLLTLSHRITPHDLSSKLKNVTKWLSKTYEVRVVINGDSNNMKCAEQVYDMIAESMKTEGRIVQKRQKGGDLRFQILPLKEEKKESSGVEV